jgi:hypothetical protein
MWSLERQIETLGMMAFAWSYSRLKNYRTCPKRFYEIDIQKNYKEESEQLKWGDEVHKALADACSKDMPLPTGMDYQKWVGFVRSRPGKLYVEQKYAITRDFSPCSFFGPTVWFRSIADVVVLYGRVALIIDWKTGKPIPDSNQLFLVSQCVFCQFPEVQRVVNQFVWLQTDDITQEIYDRADMAAQWPPLLTQVAELEKATKDLTFPPKPNKLCRSYCPVQSCPFWGKKQ